MDEIHRVLLLSTSTTFFSEAGPDQSLLGLLRSELQERHPERQWDCLGALLYITPDMAGRALGHVDSLTPDIVIVRPTSQAFMHDDVVSAIRDRWPRLYRLSVSLADRLRFLAGGARWGGQGLRGLVFKVPRWVAVRLIGVAPRVRVEDAVGYVIETLDLLVQRESIQVACEAAVGNTPNNLTAAESARRAGHFMDAVSSYCSARHIPFADLKAILGARSVAYEIDSDQYHYTMTPRAVEARELSEIIGRLAMAGNISASAAGSVSPK